MQSFPDSTDASRDMPAQSIHVRCIRHYLFGDVVEACKLRCMPFLCPSSTYDRKFYTHYAITVVMKPHRSRNETNFDTDGAITLTVIYLRGTVLHLTVSCCIFDLLLINSTRQILCKLLASCSLPVSCLNSAGAKFRIVNRDVPTQMHLLCICFTIFSDASRDIQAQMHAFLMPILDLLFYIAERN